MRVAVISDTLRPNGANIMAVESAGLLADHGHDVLLLSGSRPDPSIERRLAGREHRAFLAEDSVLDYTTGALRQDLSLSTERWVADELAAFAPEVVVCHNTGRFLDQLAVARISQRFPVVVYLHDEWFLTDQHYVTDPATPHMTLFEPFRAKSARDHDFSGLWQVPGTAGTLCAVAPSRWLVSRWRQVFPSLVCGLVHNPVSPEVFDLVDRSDARAALGISDDLELIGFVGDPRQRRKGFAVLTEAVATLPERDRPFVLAAGGPSSAAGHRVAARIDSNGLVADRLRSSGGSAVVLGGSPAETLVLSGVPRSSFKHVYGAMDLLVHPSRIENLPTVPIEATYCGTPCLVSDVGGSEEVVSDRAELFPANPTPKALAKRIREALDRARSEPAGDREARRTAALQRFSPEQHYRQLLPILQSAAA